MRKIPATFPRKILPVNSILGGEFCHLRKILCIPKIFPDKSDVYDIFEQKNVMLQKWDWPLTRNQKVLKQVSKKWQN